MLSGKPCSEMRAFVHECLCVSVYVFRAFLKFNNKLLDICICNYALSLCPIYSHHLEIFYLKLMAVVPSAVNSP